MIRLLAALFLSLAAVLGSVPAMSQGADPDANALRDIIDTELPPETKELAEKLVQLTGTARLFDSLLPTIADRAKDEFIRSNPQMQLGIISVVDKVAVELVSRRPELDRYLARVWASGFSNEEMEELVDFYGTETGKKFAQLYPKVLAVQTAAAEDWANDVARELNERVRQELAAAMAAEQEALESDTAGPALQETQPQQ
jgi:hypothetical protein